MGQAMRLELGEPAAGPWRVAPIDELVEQLHAAAGAVTGRPRIVAIDGRGGAGKSTLVQLLRAAVPSSAVVHTDDVAWHHSFFDWAGVLAEHVLEPLRRGEAVDFRPPPWAQRDRPGSIVVPAGLEVVWVEGTGVLRAQLAPLLDASVWVQVDRLTAERRLVDRDGDAPEQRRHVEEWLREEHPFLLREQPWRHATLVLAGSPVLDHVPATHVVLAPPVAP
jgi:energy-coupling factor transporter ATP-binding protein EcfA2